MIILLTGDNSFSLHQASRRLRDDFAAQHGASAVQLYDAATIGPRDIPQIFQGVSLFDPVRLVVVRDAQQNKLFWEALPDALPDNDAVTVVIEDPKPDKRTRTYKWLQKHADVRDHPPLRDNQLAAWLRAEATARGIELNAALASQLVSRVGLDQWLLIQELMKLSLTGRPISAELIAELTDAQPQATAFELLDAAMAGQTARVNELVAMLRQTEDAYRFSGLLISQVYSLALAHAAGDRPAATLARDAGLHPFVAGKMLAVAKRLGRAQLSKTIDAVVQLDTTLKSTGGDPWLPLEVTLMSIARR